MDKIKRVALGASTIVLFGLVALLVLAPDVLAVRSGAASTSFSAILHDSLAIKVFYPYSGSCSSERICFEITPTASGTAGQTSGAIGVTMYSTATNVAGSHLLMSAITTTDLTSNEGNTIPTLESDNNGSGYTISDMPVNHWGVAFSNSGAEYATAFFPVSTSPQAINSIFGPTGNGGSTYYIRPGAKVNLNTPPGNYEAILNFYAIVGAPHAEGGSND